MQRIHFNVPRNKRPPLASYWLWLCSTQNQIYKQHLGMHSSLQHILPMPTHRDRQSHRQTDSVWWLKAVVTGHNYRSTHSGGHQPPWWTIATMWFTRGQCDYQPPWWTMPTMWFTRGRCDYQPPWWTMSTMWFTRGHCDYQPPCDSLEGAAYISYK